MTATLPTKRTHTPGPLMISTKEPTPAETLRDAATRLRELAAAATPGPWGFLDDDVTTQPGVAGNDGEWVAECGPVRSRGDHDARWIATLNPTVAEPLAAWLDLASDWGDVSMRAPALAFAHLILRTETDHG